jgi:hypothetical protein
MDGDVLAQPRHVARAAVAHQQVAVGHAAGQRCDLDPAAPARQRRDARFDGRLDGVGHAPIFLSRVRERKGPIATAMGR